MRLVPPARATDAISGTLSLSMASVSVSRRLQVVQQRLQREHNVNVLVTAPTVPLQATLSDGRMVPILSPEAMPDKRDLRHALARAARIATCCLVRVAKTRAG